MPVRHPIRVNRDHYSGSNTRKLEKSRQYNADAARLEQVTNALIERRGPGVYLYHEIARESGINVERVREVMFSVDCGHGGFTVSHGADGLPGEQFKRMAENRDDDIF